MSSSKRRQLPGLSISACRVPGWQNTSIGPSGAQRAETRFAALYGLHHRLQVHDACGRAQSRATEGALRLPGQGFAHERGRLCAGKPREAGHSNSFDAEPGQDARDGVAHHRQLVQVLVSVDVGDADAAAHESARSGR